MFDNGGVIEQGTHETLTAQEGGKYKEMVEAQRIVDGMNANTTTEQADEDDEKQPCAYTFPFLSKRLRNVLCLSG